MTLQTFREKNATIGYPRTWAGLQNFRRDFVGVFEFYFAPSTEVQYLAGSVFDCAVGMVEDHALEGELFNTLHYLCDRIFNFDLAGYSEVAERLREIEGGL